MAPGLKYRSTGLNFKKPIGDQFVKQTTYIIMAMFDYSLKFLDVSWSIFSFFFSKSRSTCLYPSLFFLNYTNCKVLHIYSAGSLGISLSPESKMCQHDFWWLPIRRAQTLMTEVNKQGTDNRTKKSLNRFNLLSPIKMTKF